MVAQFEALIKSDQAAIDNARIYLGYTKITAPFDGRTGLRQVDEGNLVHAADPQGIVVITQLKPISMLFNLPQQQLLHVNDPFAQGPLTVEAVASDG
jgi:multidrug efflux system membrane fusion protein